MTTSPDYSMATNMAYEVLSQYRNFSLPIYVKEIIGRYLDIRVLTYTEAELKYGLSSDILMERSNHGFTMVRRGKRIILYNEKKDLQIIRFTLAHELGHCILEHVVDDEASDKEANCFARNVLCPIPVIKELKIQTVDDYVDVFAVSEPMAAASMGFAGYDFNLINHNLYNKMQNLLMCHTLVELHGYPDNVTPISRRLERNEYIYMSHTRRATAHRKSEFNFYVTEEEKELLDRLKFGE